MATVSSLWGVILSTPISEPYWRSMVRGVGAGGDGYSSLGTAAYGCQYPITTPVHNYSGSSSGYENTTPDQVKIGYG